MPKFHEILVHSYNSWFLKTLDTHSFFALKTPMPKGIRRAAGDRRPCGTGAREKEQ